MGVVGYILGLIFITVLSLVSLIFFLINTDPGTLRVSEFVIFYLSFFLSLSGIFALMGTVFRKINRKERLSWKMIRVALRQAIIFALMLSLFLILMSQGLLTYPIAILTILMSILIETLIQLIEKRLYAKGTSKN